MIRLSLLSLLATAVYAQTDAAALSGLVTDPSSALVSGAAIQLRSNTTSAVRTALSGTDGRYQFNLLPPGEYEISAEATGFKKFVASGIHVQVAQQSQLNIGLQVGSTTESVQVEASVSMRNPWRKVP